MYILWIQAELIEMELLIAKGGSDVDRNYTTYSNDFSEENERDDMRQTVPILFEDFSTRIKEEKNGTRNTVCSMYLVFPNQIFKISYTQSSAYAIFGSQKPNSQELS